MSFEDDEDRDNPMRLSGPLSQSFYPFTEIICYKCSSLFILKANDPRPFQVGMICPHCKELNSPKQMLSQIRKYNFPPQSSGLCS